MTHHRLCLPGDKALHHLCLALRRLQCRTATMTNTAVTQEQPQHNTPQGSCLLTRKMDTAFGIMRRTVAAPCTSIRSTTSAFADSASST